MLPAVLQISNTGTSWDRKVQLGLESSAGTRKFSWDQKTRLGPDCSQARTVASKWFVGYEVTKAAAVQAEHGKGS